MSVNGAREGETDPLIDFRDQITLVTEELVRLLDMRTALGRQIGTIKASRGATQIRDLDREAQVLNHAEQVSDGTTSPHALRHIIQTIMDASSADQAAVTGLPLGGPPQTPPPDVVRSSEWRGW